MTILEVIAKFQRVLPSIEQAIPPGAKHRKGNIHKDITRTRKLHLSELNTQDLVDWVEIDMVTPEENSTHTAYFDDQLLQLEDATTDTQNLMTDAQDALEWFYDTLCTHWPLDCKDSHRALLRLVADRHDMSKDGGLVEQFEFDTLSSTHSKHWGRIRFQGQTATRSSKVRFKGVADVNSPCLNQAPLDLCRIIERSGNGRVCSIVNLNYCYDSEPRGHKGVKNSKPLIRLEGLLKSTGTRATIERANRNPLTILQRANLAVVFASSLLQLSKGSWGKGSLSERHWLQRNWNDSGICFLQNHHGMPVVDEPYLPILINQEPEESTLSYPPPSFVALALTLLLLQNDDDEVIAEFDFIRNDIVAEEEGVVKDTTDFFTLLSLIESDAFKRHVDDHYKRAIKSCLTGRLVNTIGEDEWEAQDYFSRDIIYPLKQYLNAVRDPVGPRIQLQPSKKELSLLADANGEKHEVHTRQARYADEWFSKFENKVHELVKLRPGDKQKAAIKIAILDTGLDLPPEAETLYEDQIISHRSWVSCDEWGHTKLDLDGHGTHCASVILKVAQNANIYVARVFETRSQRRVESKTINNAIVQALTCAIDEWQVDIIAMSFGCPDRVNEIEEVMKRAQNDGIIMIAAASNSGALESVSWPARSERVIGVHALDGYGNCSDFTPNPQTHERNFAAPGIAISGYWPKALGMTERRMTGTSCAAPVVAGIVAVLLEFARKHESELAEDDIEVLGQLKERQGIIKVLDRMCVRNQRNRYEFLMPWELLDATDGNTNSSRMRDILKALRNTS